MPHRTLIQSAFMAVLMSAAGLPAFADTQMSIGLGSMRFVDDRETVPTIDLACQKRTLAGAGMDVRLATFVLVSTLDLGVSYSMGERVRVTPRIGPSLLVVAIGFVLPGAACGLQLALPAGRGNGVAFDFSVRAYLVEGEEPLFPMTSVGVSYFWGGAGR